VKSLRRDVADSLPRGHDLGDRAFGLSGGLASLAQEASTLNTM